MKKEQTFEQAIERLQEIVAQLENGDTPLEESLKLFNEGTKLADLCGSKLKNAEQTIINISGEIQDNQDNQEIQNDEGNIPDEL